MNKASFDLSPEEEDFGFAERETPTGVWPIAELRAGLRAIKRQAPDGTVHYEVCDESHHPLYAPARSVEELRQRFSRSSQ